MFNLVFIIRHVRTFIFHWCFLKQFLISDEELWHLALKFEIMLTRMMIWNLKFVEYALKAEDCWNKQTYLLKIKCLIFIRNVMKRTILHIIKLIVRNTQQLRTLLVKL